MLIILLIRTVLFQVLCMPVPPRCLICLSWVKHRQGASQMWLNYTGIARYPGLTEYSNVGTPFHIFFLNLFFLTHSNIRSTKPFITWQWNLSWARENCMLMVTLKMNSEVKRKAKACSCHLNEILLLIQLFFIVWFLQYNLKPGPNKK